MLTIQIEEKFIKNEDGSERKKKYIIVNGIEDKDSAYYETGIPYAYFENEEIIELLLNYSFKEIGNSIPKFEFYKEFDWWGDLLEIGIYCKEYSNEKIPCIKITLQLLEMEHWAKPWSVSSLAQEFELNIVSLGNDKLKYWQEDPDSIMNCFFGIVYFPDNITSIIKPEIDDVLSLLETVLDKTNKNLLESLDTEVVLTYFQFPEEIKTACKQYLVYFTQFIADMGILVNTELKEELNHTLFKVIPKNKEESLEKIREALNIYLNAPNDLSFQVQLSHQTDIAAKQWEANFYHLKSQLSLANSINQANDSTIEMLQLSNYQYRQLLESHNLKRESEYEKILNGIVTIKKFEGKGFSIDIAEIFRMLKRRFKK